MAQYRIQTHKLDEVDALTLEKRLNADLEAGWRTLSVVVVDDRLVLVQYGSDPEEPFALAL